MCIRDRTPCEATSAAATDLHALGCHETVFCCGCKNIKRLVLHHITSRYVRHPHSDFRFQLGAGISTPDSRKPFRDRDSGIFFAEIWSDPGCIKVGFLRFGQIRGQQNFRSQCIKVGLTHEKKKKNEGELQFFSYICLLHRVKISFKTSSNWSHSAVWFKLKS